jgi:hypothetical protein
MRPPNYNAALGENRGRGGVEEKAPPKRRPADNRPASRQLMPSCALKPSRQAVHCVAAEVMTKTMIRTTAI